MEPLMSSILTTHAPSLLQRIQRGISGVELIHTPHQGWPNRCSQIRPFARPLRISVLDSSFNPPTLAHLALANSAVLRSSESSAGDITRLVSPTDDACNDYDATLLLLSIRNADKSLKANDATYLQRLEMMVLLAKDIQAHYSERRPTSTDIEREANVAVAIINEPTFVGKSSTLLSFLRQRLANILSPSLDTHDPALPVPPQLTFLQGFDTLERLLSPRYYASEAAMWQALHDFFSAQKDDSRVVCARRVSFVGQEEEGQSKTIDRAKEFIASGRITLIDIGEAEQTFSSSEVRNEVMQGNDGWQRLVSTAVANYIRQQKLYCA